MSLRVFITRDYDQMSQVAADVAIGKLRARIAQKGGAVLGLATGASPTGLYKHLAKAANSGEFDADKIRTFNLDEYVGLPGGNAQLRALHPESYSYFMVQELFSLMRKKFASTQVPYGCLVDQAALDQALASATEDYHLEGADKGKAVVIHPDAKDATLAAIKRDVLDAYPAAIRAAGGIDLHVVGVGGRGHVAFHESGIPFEQNEMLLVKLDANTVENAVKDGHFPSVEASPRYAISMGAVMVYEAREILLLASGARKSEPLAASLADEVSPAVPISYSQLHSARGGTTTYVVDEAAAQGILARRSEIEAKGFELVDLRGLGHVVPLESIAFVRDGKTGLMG
ncbi:MAG: 6-phosphogluconolactonase [Kiritimatiellae bacterium]|nr:6-phosphogluconolactonase [Kiritimatiellia bacterium]